MFSSRSGSGRSRKAGDAAKLRVAVLDQTLALRALELTSAGALQKRNSIGGRAAIDIAARRRRAALALGRLPRSR